MDCSNKSINPTMINQFHIDFKKCFNIFIWYFRKGRGLGFLPPPITHPCVASFFFLGGGGGTYIIPPPPWTLLPPPGHAPVCVYGCINLTRPPWSLDSCLRNATMLNTNTFRGTHGGLRNCRNRGIILRKF